MLGLKRPPTIDVSPYLGNSVKAQIPKVLHFVWVGDQTKRPDACIDSWRLHHPDYEIKIWGNEEYRARDWLLKHHMEVAWHRELCGVADLMRYEILATEGGIALDADSICVRRLPDWLLECEAFGAQANPFGKRFLVAVGVLGSRPANPFFQRVVSHFQRQPRLFDRTAWLFFKKRVPAWKASGPVPLTEAVLREQYLGITMLPSHFFYPQFKRGVHVYRGGGPVYAYQFWGSTFGYDEVDRIAASIADGTFSQRQQS